jgi:hypothetical protein
LATAAFHAKSDLFAIPLGTTLKNALDNKPIQRDVEILFSFRNCLAHANSAFYLHYEDYESDGIEFVLEGKYGVVRKYLFEKGLLTEHKGLKGLNITGAENLFTDKIADHFVSIVEPYMREVLKLLPKNQQDSIGLMVNMAFDF